MAVSLSAKRVRHGLFAVSSIVAVTAAPLVMSARSGALGETVCPVGCAFSSIQGAVNAAADGDTITVGDGVYNESVTVTKTVTLQSATKYGARVVGSYDYSGSAFTIMARSVIIDGFTIGDPAMSYETIAVDASLATSPVIRNNKIEHASVGVYAGYGTTGATVIGNTFANLNSADTSLNYGIYGDGMNTISVANNTFAGIGNQALMLANGSNVYITSNSFGTTPSAALLARINNASFARNEGADFTADAVTLSAVSSILVADNILGGTKVADGFKLSGTYGPSSYVTLSGNGIFGFENAINVESAVGSVIANNNFLSGNEASGIRVAPGAVQVDAPSNWWGSANGPRDTVSGDNSVYDTNNGSGTAAIGAVKYAGWCTNSSCGKFVEPQTIDDCKNGNYATYTTASGKTFKNQGLCVSYVNGRTSGPSSN